MSIDHEICKMGSIVHDENTDFQKELVRLEFWTEHGLSAVPFIRQLIREHILHDSIIEGEERLYFVFDQMERLLLCKSDYRKMSNKEKKLVNIYLRKF